MSQCNSRNIFHYDIYDGNRPEAIKQLKGLCFKKIVDYVPDTVVVPLSDNDVSGSVDNDSDTDNMVIRSDND